MLGSGSIRGSANTATAARPQTYPSSTWTRPATWRCGKALSIGLATATQDEPHGIINVGIFGEGTDSPSLSAVAFLEPRKSPIDVIQAVGRAMRAVPDKSKGYIICPIVVPPNADAEDWLSTSSPEEGWQELGQILLALRSHDQRIEDELADLLHLYLPKPPAKVHTFIGVAGGENKRIRYFTHEGAPGDAQEDLERVLKGARPRETGFAPLPASETFAPPAWAAGTDSTKDSVAGQDRGTLKYPEAPTTIMTGKVQEDGSYNLRTDTVVRDKPKTGESHGSLNVRKTKNRARDMINKDFGKSLPDSKKERKKKSKDGARAVQQQLQLQVMKEFGDSIRLNLLEKSGLTDDRVLRDLNILEDGIREAAFHLNSDELRPTLDRHFGLDNLKASDQHKQADGCTHCRPADDECGHVAPAHSQRPMALRRERSSRGQERGQRGAPDQQRVGPGSAPRLSARS